MGKALAPFSPNTASFEDTYKTAYSHGLEEIYALENVDISSVKPISIPQKKKEKKTPLKNKPAAITQLSLNLGGEYRERLDAFCLKEPIQVLNLPKHVEMKLAENECFVLRDLLEMELKGLGQGHLDEIDKKLSQHTLGKELYHSDSVDFASLFRCLTAGIDRKKVKVVLEEFDLQEMISLTHAENMEVKRMTLEKKHTSKREVLEHLSKNQVGTLMDDVVDVFIKPWMRHRYGIAKKCELLERLQKVGEDPEVAESILALIKYEFQDSLCEVDEELYCVDKGVAKQYSYVVEKANSYFYQPHLNYSLSELVTWIKRECARDWEGFSEGFIEKALRLSHQFRVRKGDVGVLVVRLA